MLNYIWAFMILIGVVYGAFTGKMAEVTNAALDSAGGRGISMHHYDRRDGAVGGAYGDRAEIGFDCKADERDTALHQVPISENSGRASGEGVYRYESDCQCAGAWLGVYAGGA